MHGLDAGFNDRAYERAIVMHGAPYVSEDAIKLQGPSAAAGAARAARRHRPRSDRHGEGQRAGVRLLPRSAVAGVVEVSRRLRQRRGRIALHVSAETRPTFTHLPSPARRSDKAVTLWERRIRSMNLDEFEAEALKLEPAARARYGDGVAWLSLEVLSDEENSRLWAEEAQRRDEASESSESGAAGGAGVSRGARATEVDVLGRRIWTPEIERR